MCSIKFFEVYKGKYIGDVFGYDVKGPLIDKCIMKTDSYNFGFATHAENSSGKWILSHNIILGNVQINTRTFIADIFSVEEFFEITKIDFEDII